MPSFEGGGVEKNIILFVNYFIKKNIEISLITASKKVAKKIDPKIKFVAPQNFFGIILVEQLSIWFVLFY